MKEWFKKPTGAAIIVLILLIVGIIVLSLIHGVSIRRKSDYTNSSGVTVEVVSPTSSSSAEDSSKVIAEITDENLPNEEVVNKENSQEVTEPSSETVTETSESSTAQKRVSDFTSPKEDIGYSDLTSMPDVGGEFSVKAQVTGKGVSTLRDQYLYRLDLSITDNKGDVTVFPYYTQFNTYKSVEKGDYLDVTISVNDEGYFSFINISR